MRRKLTFPSMVDNFRSTFRPHDTHPLHYDAMNELKNGTVQQFCFTANEAVCGMT